jgi:molybdate transport system regulatory protein
MAGKTSKLKVKSKIWIENDKEAMVFGLGRLRILDAIEKHGSILGASKALNMSYRAAWGKIKATEERLGQPLLKRKVGGGSGGGSKLTPFANALLQKFRYLQSLVEKEADMLFEDLFLTAATDQKERKVL